VTVRVIELESHPLQASIGPRWAPPIGATDRLLKRASGEATFGIPPDGEVRVSLLGLKDGWTDDDPTIAYLPWMNPGDDREVQPGVLVLPSTDERRSWSEQYPDLATIMDAPAMVRLEIAATNVPARLYTVKVYRTTDAPSGQHLPVNPDLRTAIAFRLDLVPGRAPYNQTLHASQLPVGSSTPRPRTPS
jgi:hypothetical protein